MLLAPEAEAAIDRTLELGEKLHVNLGADGLLVGAEILYPTLGRVDLEPLRDRFGLELKLPFRFAASARSRSLSLNDGREPAAAHRYS